MADQFTGEIIPPSQIDSAIKQRVGPPSPERQQAQDFASWRYNQPIGEFGTAYPKSRRQMRMQEEFQKFQAQQAEQQRAAQQLNLQQMEAERLQRDQDLRFENARIESEKARIAQDRDAKILNEAGSIVDAIRGSVAPDGRIIENPIRPEDDDAIERLEGLSRFKFGMENKAAQDMWSTLYNDALKFRQDKIDQSQKQELAAINLSVQTGKPFKELGTYTEQGLFKSNVPAMIGAAEQVKTAEEKKAEEAAIATETRRAEAQAGVMEERNIISQEREIQKGIRKATEDLRKMNAALAGKESLSERDQAILQTAKDTLIDLQIEKAALRNLVFESPEQYKSAVDAGNKPPAGTTIYIGRTPVKVK